VCLQIPVPSVFRGLVGRLDATLVALVDEPDRLGRLAVEFGHLRALLESHFRYEEEQIAGPLGVHRVMI
jgi:hypothetical protein